MNVWEMRCLLRACLWPPGVLSVDGPPLVHGQKLAAACRTNVLVMHLPTIAAEAIIEAEFVEHRLQIIHVHLRSITFTASPALRASATVARLLVKRHAQGACALEDVEELSERNVKKQRNHAEHMHHCP